MIALFGSLVLAWHNFLLVYWQLFTLLLTITLNTEYSADLKNNSISIWYFVHLFRSPVQCLLCLPQCSMQHLFSASQDLSVYNTLRRGYIMVALLVFMSTYSA